MSKLEQATHKRLIDAYTAEFPAYKRYAAALKKCLEDACGVALPEALVQARPKSIASFAEKCVRKWEKYNPDPLAKMTDLCGARVIVQTLQQVKAVRQFIEANFMIVESDDKTESLGATEFGYRDMHYIVRLKPGLPPLPGMTAEDVAAIGDRPAEVQVRTWVQHAWADTLHDRMYKTKLKYPAETKRIGALLAAIMEDGDRSFDRLAEDIDGMLANYSAYASAGDVAAEIAVQRLILSNTPVEKQAGLALPLARLLVAGGQYEEAVAALNDLVQHAGNLLDEVQVELGFARCRQHVAQPRGDGFRQGQAELQAAVDRLAAMPHDFVPNLRRQRSLRAKALARLAWSHSLVPGGAPRSREQYQAALSLEPTNPYYLAEVVGHEVNWLGRLDAVGSMKPVLQAAIATCNEHIANGTELPYACFTAGRLCLLVGDGPAALGHYARGILHVRLAASAMPPDLLDIEEQWLHLVTGAHTPPEGFRWCLDLLTLARRKPTPADVSASPVLIVAGGAATVSAAGVDEVRDLLRKALRGLSGLVISGGTKVGVPGCVGEVAAELRAAGQGAFRTRGYLPKSRGDDAPRDDRYDELIVQGETFSPEQILRCWQDLLVAGVSPTSVRLLGYGGGRIAACEYRIALALGASVGLVVTSGGSVDAMLKDLAWQAVPNLDLLPLPADAGTVRAFVHPTQADFPAATLEGMAQAFHENYVAGSAGQIPRNMWPWAKLDQTYKTANLEQAGYATQILTACGFDVRPVADPAKPVIFDDFTSAEIEHMSELEHGRWNVERLRNGWRFGPRKDEKQQRHPCLVPWAQLSDGENGVKRYDRDSVRKFPEILAKAGLEVIRK